MTTASLKDVAGVVLAAGRSERMGRTKALLPYSTEPDSPTFVRRCLAVLAEAGIHRRVVVVNPETRESIGREVGDDAAIAVNPSPENGMVSSINSALALLVPPPRRLIVALVDIPEISMASVKALRECADDEAFLIFPLYADGRGHPLAVNAAAFSLLDENLPKGLKSLAAAHPDRVKEIALEGRQPWDVDTPEDYRRFR